MFRCSGSGFRCSGFRSWGFSSGVWGSAIEFGVRPIRLRPISTSANFDFGQFRFRPIVEEVNRLRATVEELRRERISWMSEIARRADVSRGGESMRMASLIDQADEKLRAASCFQPYEVVHCEWTSHLLGVDALESDFTPVARRRQPRFLVLLNSEGHARHVSVAATTSQDVASF